MGQVFPSAKVFAIQHLPLASNSPSAREPLGKEETEAQRNVLICPGRERGRGVTVSITHQVAITLHASLGLQLEHVRSRT